MILGGYIAYFMYLYGIHPAWGVIVSPIIMFFVGIAIYKLVINKVVDRDLFISILATFGISILFMQLMNFAFGADVVLANSDYGTTMLFNNNVVLPNSKIFSAFISILFAICLVIYMKKSKLGRAIRATAQNARAAKILGVDTEKVYAATFGISILFMQLMNFAFGADVVLANSGYGTTMLFDNNVVLPNSKIFSAFISIVFAICLVVYMIRSKLGRAIRATAQNARAAKILGVDTEKVYAATFGNNAALCGVAGALISITFTIHPYMGLPYTIRSFMIVIIAGLGNLPGVAMSGMGLGVFEEFADYILGTEFRIGSVFLLLVLILVYRRFKLSRKREYLK